MKVSVDNTQQQAEPIKVELIHSQKQTGLSKVNQGISTVILVGVAAMYFKMLYKLNKLFDKSMAEQEARTERVVSPDVENLNK